MDTPNAGATPIGWTELLAGTVAALFAVVSAWALLTVIANAPRVADAAAQQAFGAAGSAPLDGCARGPVLGGLRLGTPRVYGQGRVALEPALLSVVPVVSAPDAYRTAALKAPGCQTEELLAYYSGGAPAVQRVLAWTVVSTSACGSRRCVTVSAVDATTGQVIPPTFFGVEPGK
ncbi:MAG TPA: hypothetical protein VGR61_04825 [Candidatus Dormibacteraeota bacterium]|nr:hypothetical protein [Candidatus Dormibacteraeota bacterium]